MLGGDQQHFEAGLKQAGPDKLRPGEWAKYPHYEFLERDGRKYLIARETVAQLRGRFRYRPLSLDYADLFVEFAGWAEKMSRSDPDEERNEEAMRAWAMNYGVLGLDEPRLVLLGESSVFIQDYLGRPGPDGSIGRGMLNEGFGGPAETVARFTDEALEARAVLRLYNAAISRDTKAITDLMGKKSDDDLGYPSIRESYGGSQDSARAWALRVVQETVNRKVAGRCHPTLHGGPSSYEQGWAFNSLLGAMWLQMLFRLTGQTRVCLWCGTVLAFGEETQEGCTSGRKPRSDRAFCDELCRSKWNYHEGQGKSNKHARKQARDRT
jgi:hypothetical protein